MSTFLGAAASMAWLPLGLLAWLWWDRRRHS